MPKVRVKSLRSLASKMNPSILTGAITESANYIEELELEIENLKVEKRRINDIANKGLFNHDITTLEDIRNITNYQ